MSEYITDNDGKWLIQGGMKFLVEPSESYLLKMQAEEQQRLETELLKSLKPAEKEVLMAEIEINTINLLLELEVV